VDERCVFCGAPNSRHGEHVLPRWFLRRWSGEGPFTHEVNGRPIPDRHGNPRKASDLPSYRLPVCDQWSGPGCNSTLNRLYEQPGKKHVRSVLDEMAPLDQPEEVVAFTHWWIKTILLLQHPKTINVFPGAVMRRPWKLPSKTYSELLKRSFPPDLSLWLALSDDVHGREQLPERLRLFLPETSTPDGQGGEPGTSLNGYRQAGTRMLLVQCVLHPLCDLEHPFEQAGLAMRVWPDPPPRLDIAVLPILGKEGRDQLGALFVNGNFAERLPAMGWRTRVEAVPDGGPMPLVPRWHIPA
jgi:hypothetical protein